MRVLILALCFVTTLSACTWVPIESVGKTVRVLPWGTVPSDCQSQGEITVSVKNKIGFYTRNALRVQDELETLARNEAPSINANTVQALGQPVDGTQRFVAFRCGGR
ncbi:DUF4156 domain-containing protein [Xylella fastidiosa subsp. morus]|jgi:hypothetical protein|uniref:DUF4156 domain-containing protein n=2 Tax=Xylella fastidiosa TaxID=2371 RepID=A0AAJ5R4M4_XYLFS|nr:DUF4156 domain-containing protein [Xylella fastidiosa]ADN63848.1 putative secreted protein [Xylella fastidiosa subsp. fastidiosa GB514]KAF0572022.1 hypothetical protein P305_01660 [Xylella fastidiosa subsp. fastidiosa Mus-1]ACB92315.1 putative secreted protein [Xylella fastidiosa M23]AIC12379.1 hypothetical protein P303_04325 [Xylella fastidiosa MUL0034]EGO81794.1 hypothetical protein XFEB_01270 [Xylella fastidiosa EB92.1]